MCLSALSRAGTDLGTGLPALSICRRAPQPSLTDLSAMLFLIQHPHSPLVGEITQPLVQCNAPQWTDTLTSTVGHIGQFEVKVYMMYAKKYTISIGLQ